MKFIKKCPVFILLISTGLLFTIIGIAGKNNIYAEQEYDLLTMPVMAVVFTGINDEIYPWQVLIQENREVMAQGTDDMEEETADIPEENVNSVEDGSGEETTDTSSGEDPSDEESEQGIENVLDKAQIPEPEEEEVIDEMPLERLEPLRESTREEYLNHISADIYGDAGVLRAAAYEFDTVDESYFDDALFIGDSRTVGLRDYTDLAEHADFYCETSLTIYKAMEEEFAGLGTVKDALENNDYGKIYLMVGINELGRGTTEDFMEKYTEVVDTLHELEPEAKIFIQGIIRVSGKKSSSDAIFNNNNINARNNAIATLADNKEIFYIDVNEVICDEEGNLHADYTFDQIHLLGVYDELWKQFLLEHGVID